MKIRDYKKHTFAICMAWYKNPTVQNTDRLANNLRRWARFTRYGNEAAYNYQPSEYNLRERVEYCSDRMTQGRAKAILKLMDHQLESLFSEPASLLTGAGRHIIEP